MDLSPEVVTVAITRVDGGLTVMRVIKTSYCPGENGERVIRREVDVTPEYIEQQIAKHVAGGNWVDGQLPTSWRIVPNNFLNEDTDRTFRDAWKDGGKGKPDHDMVKARDILRFRLRKERGNYLDALDADYMRADEAGDTKRKKEIAVWKQKLRDAPDDPRIEAAKTVDELKALTLAVLAG